MCYTLAESSGNKDSDLSLTLSDDGNDADHSTEVPVPMDDDDDVKTPTAGANQGQTCRSFKVINHEICKKNHPFLVTGQALAKIL